MTALKSFQDYNTLFVPKSSSENNNNNKLRSYL